MFNAIETVTDAIVTDSLFRQNNVNADDDNEAKRKGERAGVGGGGGGNSSSIVQQSGKFSKRQISRELFVVNQDGNSNQCDKSDNDNNNRVGSNCELSRGRSLTPSTTAAPPSASGRSGNRRKFFPDSSALSFGEIESPRFVNASLTEATASSTPTTLPPFKMNRSLDEMSTPNSSFQFNNTKSSFGGNSSRKSFDYSGNKNNNSISRRNMSSPLCLGDFINTSGASSSGKQGTTAAGGELVARNLI